MRYNEGLPTCIEKKTDLKMDFQIIQTCPYLNRDGMTLVHCEILLWTGTNIFLSCWISFMLFFFCITLSYVDFDCYWALRRISVLCWMFLLPFAMTDKLEQDHANKQFRIFILMCTRLRLSMSDCHQALCCQFVYFCFYEVPHNLVL